MWSGLLWFGLLTAGMLAYPRRPRIAGVLWIALGVLTAAFNLQRSPGNPRGLVGGAFMIAMGLWHLLRYRRADVRAKHVEYWTAKA
jgi:hypothetical protein